MIDLTGERFGRLMVVSATRLKGKLAWECDCDCGNTHIVQSKYLHAGKVNSCGCIRRERSRSGVAAFKHGHCSHPLYNVWRGLHERCYNEKTESYRHYGGRGIKVCERWSDFKNFLKDMGERPLPTDTIDRIDNNGDYEPDNCRWADHKTQCRNRRTNHLLTCDGQTKTLAEWAEITGIGYATIKTRVDNLGWSDSAAIKTPINQLYSAVCCECGTSFGSNSRSAKYCNQVCKAKAAWQRNGPKQNAKKKERRFSQNF